MSTSLATIPKGARLVRRLRTTAHDGSPAIISLWAAEESLGYQSDYRRIPTAYYAVDAPGIVRRAWRYSGRRIGRAEADYRAAIATLEAAGTTYTEDVR